MKTAMTVLLFASALIAGCGDQPEGNRQESVAPVSPTDEAQAQRQAHENRKRFMGDGKARYTPQRVEGF